MGVVGFFMFLACMALLLVQYEPFSGASAGENAVMRQAGDQKEGKLWLGGCLLANTVFPLLSALILFHFKVDKVVNGFFMQGMPLFYGVWGTVNALFVILTTVVWYQCYAKKNGISLDSIDLKISAAHLGKTVATALTVTGLALTLLFVVKFFFNTDFRILYWAVRPFNARRLLESLKLLPLFMVAYVTASVFINCLNSDWMVPPLLLLFITPFITRAIYRKTKNPYLGGIINAVIVTIMTCVNAQIVFPT